MRTVTLLAQRPLDYAGRVVGAGEPFEATPIDAAVLTYRGQAVFAPPGVRSRPPAPVVPTAAPSTADAAEPEAGASRRRRYRRRDLTAED